MEHHYTLISGSSIKQCAALGDYRLADRRNYRFEILKQLEHLAYGITPKPPLFINLPLPGVMFMQAMCCKYNLTVYLKCDSSASDAQVAAANTLSASTQEKQTKEE